MRGISNSSKGRSSPTSFWPTRSTGRARARSRACSRRWRTARFSVEGQERRLAEPFLVLATRNPIEFHGTFPVPEAALDRFLVRVELDYPAEDQELALYRGENRERRLEELEPILELEELGQLQRAVDTVDVAEAIARYAYRVVTATREEESVLLGASPRAAMQWLQACRARALMNERDYVLPDDLKAMAEPVLGHRIFLRGGGDARALLDRILSSTPVEL
jgi:MoxR-like ATPase